MGPNIYINLDEAGYFFVFVVKRLYVGDVADTEMIRKLNYNLLDTPPPGDQMFSNKINTLLGQIAFKF